MKHQSGIFCSGRRCSISFHMSGKEPMYVVRIDLGPPGHSTEKKDSVVSE